MSCCGQKRAQFLNAQYGRPAFDHQKQTESPAVRKSAPVAVVFEYVGTTELTGLGPVTRKLYRFTPHARVAVDGRDAPSIASVPNLRRVS